MNITEINSLVQQRGGNVRNVTTDGSDKVNILDNIGAVHGCSSKLEIGRVSGRGSG